MAPSPFPASPVPIGSLVAGKYRVDGVLGRGGMGVVVAATDLGLERKVAIKFVERQDEQAAARFLREARAAARVDSEHVTRVFEVGLEQKAPFIVMERLEGQDLAALIAAGPVPGPAVAGYGLQICEALAQAHAARIVHRDLKPENLFLHTRADGRRMIKVLDFGISKSLEGTVLTQSQAIVGTPQYLAPEQIEHPEQVDPRTDIWALGVVLYELSSGERPFRGGSMAELCMNILGAEPVPLGSKVRGLPPGLERSVQRCLRKAMDERFANVAELARELATASDSDSALLLSTIERAARRRTPAPTGAAATATPNAALLAPMDSAFAGPALAATPVADTVRSAFGEGTAGKASRPFGGALAVAATVALGAAVWWNARIQRETRVESALATTATAPALVPGPVSVPSGASAPAAAQTPVVSSPSTASSPVAEPSAPTPAATSVPAPTAPGAKPPERTARDRSATRASASASTALSPTPLARSASPAATVAASTPVAPAENSAEHGNAPTPLAASAGTTSCRVLEVIANGRKVEPAAGRVTFEWARRSCAQHAQPGGEPYDLSDAGMSVKCVCD